MPGGPAAQDGIRVDGEDEEDGEGEKALGVFWSTDEVRDMGPPPAV
ncbi:hypothetical protein PV379_07965 [Streptomyces caniscabiei]|nr:hypothetical protein [Streptomyces caniscabiei]MDX2602750.1 hypothetical protein [Streptomyces caniscabiei]MDX2737963.1 hypothetical protein [Streptomyces caniscabiei]MDX2777249.1 hypothetical protein [Streptomyces caniscabiei]